VLVALHGKFNVGFNKWKRFPLLSRDCEKSPVLSSAVGTEHWSGLRGGKAVCEFLIPKEKSFSILIEQAGI